MRLKSYFVFLLVVIGLFLVAVGLPEENLLTIAIGSAIAIVGIAIGIYTKVLSWKKIRFN